MPSATHRHVPAGQGGLGALLSSFIGRDGPAPEGEKSAACLAGMACCAPPPLGSTRPAGALLLSYDISHEAVGQAAWPALRAGVPLTSLPYAQSSRCPALP